VQPGTREELYRVEALLPACGLRRRAPVEPGYRRGERFSGVIDQETGLGHALATPIARGGPNRSATCRITSKAVRSTAWASYSAQPPRSRLVGVCSGGKLQGTCRLRRKRTL
jgi:hypothetical protein